MRISDWSSDVCSSDLQPIVDTKQQDKQFAVDPHHNGADNKNNDASHEQAIDDRPDTRDGNNDQAQEIDNLDDRWRDHLVELQQWMHAYLPRGCLNFCEPRRRHMPLPRPCAKFLHRNAANTSFFRIRPLEGGRWEARRVVKEW